RKRRPRWSSDRPRTKPAHPTLPTLQAEDRSTTMSDSPQMTSPTPAAPDTPASPRRTLLDMDRYQWTVLFAAWLGWGFDVFDGLLFNYVAPNCVPTLLGLPIGSVAAKAATLKWGGILTSMLLLGWAAGGILFGRIADRIGRKRTLLLTMLLYALGTAL